jgi:hypothetical protein
MALRSSIPEILAGLQAAIDEGAYGTAFDALAALNAETPVDTGDLVSTERIEPKLGDGDGTYRVIAGGQDGNVTGAFVDYADDVENRDAYAEPAITSVDPAKRPAERIQALVRQARLR